MNEETKSKLLKLWNESKDKGTWSFFGGTFTVDGQKWQVIPEGKERTKIFKMFLNVWLCQTNR